MDGLKIDRRFAAALVLCAVSGMLHAEDQVQWRFWGVHEGFAESYTYRFSVTPNGSAYARHGAVRSMSVFDGYRVTLIPEPRRDPQPYWPQETRVRSCLGCAPWVVSEGDLRAFENGRWVTYYSPPAGEKLVGVVPTPNRVVVIAASGLREFFPATRTWREIDAAGHSAIRPFFRVTSSPSGEIWVTGEHGLGRLLGAADGGSYQWTETQADERFTRFDSPQPGARGEVFAKASFRRDGRHAIVRWVGSGIEPVYTSAEDSLSGWRGPDGLVWIVEGASMYRLYGGQKHKVERTGILSGTIFDVFAEGDHTFWISTSEGVARYTPSLWRAPPGLEDLDTTVHAVAEDAAGHLWFAATEWLLEFDGAAWKRYPLPVGVETHAVQTSSVIPLADGRVLVKAVHTDRSDLVLIFDPRSGRFEELVHPEGRRITLIYQRRAGGAWVATEVPHHAGFRLEIYDGASFETRAEVGAEWREANLRCVMERDNGDLWLGGSAGGGVYRKGRLLDVFSVAKGYTDAGVFALGTLPSGEIIAGGRDQVLKYDGHNWTLLRGGLDRIRGFTLSKGGSLWVASASGIHCFRDGSWITYQTDEGLPSVMAYLVFEDKHGRLWAGTTRGLIRYHGEADFDPPHTLLERTLNARDVPPSGELRVFFTGIDKWNQTKPERLLFSHRIDAGTWSPFLPYAAAAFHSLSAGEHLFQVRAMDRSGNIDPVPQSLTFLVQLPWYRQFGFLSLMGLALAAIASLTSLAALQYRRRGELIVQLHDASVEAEAANRAKSEFLANMSHEIRTPLNAVLGYVQLLQTTRLSSEQEAYVATIDQSGRLLASTVNDILDFTKISTGMMTLEQLPCSLHDLLDNVGRTENVSRKVRSGAIEISQQYADDVPPYIVTDGTRLTQVLNNLLNNAIKFTESGSVTYGVGRQGEFLEFFVKDTGIGIPKDRQTAIFEPLVQADTSTTRKYGGTGLGLSITKSLVELLGGKIGLESTVGVGSRFYFTHPLVVADSAPIERPAAAAVGSGPKRRLKILVAEDNPFNQLVLVNMLKKLGCANVTVVGDGQKAVAACLGGPFDLVFMDMLMPVLDGLEAVRKIRENELNGSKPVKSRIVAVTASALADDKKRCLAAGCDEYLAKPVSMSDVERMLRLGDAGAGAVKEPRIVLADDDKASATLTEVVLQELGYTDIERVGDGVQAVEAYSRRAVDIFLMDARMPRLDGFETTEKLRALGSKAPIIVFSASDFEEERQRARQAGSTEYILKGGGVDDIREALRSCLARHLGPRS